MKHRVKFPWRPAAQRAHNQGIAWFAEHSADCLRLPQPPGNMFWFRASSRIDHLIPHPTVAPPESGPRPAFLPALRLGVAEEPAIACETCRSDRYLVHEQVSPVPAAGRTPVGFEPGVLVRKLRGIPRRAQHPGAVLAVFHSGAWLQRGRPMVRS